MPSPPPAPALDVVGYAVAVALGPERERDLLNLRRPNDRDVVRNPRLAGTSPVSCTTSRRVTGRIANQPGLAHVLDQIADGRVAGLVVARLGDVTRLVSELAELLRWLDKAARS